MQVKGLATPEIPSSEQEIKIQQADIQHGNTRLTNDALTPDNTGQISRTSSQAASMRTDSTYEGQCFQAHQQTLDALQLEPEFLKLRGKSIQCTLTQLQAQLKDPTDQRQLDRLSQHINDVLNDLDPAAHIVPGVSETKNAPSTFTCEAVANSLTTIEHCLATIKTLSNASGQPEKLNQLQAEQLVDVEQQLTQASTLETQLQSIEAERPTLYRNHFLNWGNNWQWIRKLPNVLKALDQLPPNQPLTRGHLFNSLIGLAQSGKLDKPTQRPESELLNQLQSLLKRPQLKDALRLYSGTTPNSTPRETCESIIETLQIKGTTDQLDELETALGELKQTLNSIKLPKAKFFQISPPFTKTDRANLIERIEQLEQLIGLSDYAKTLPQLQSKLGCDSLDETFQRLCQLQPYQPHINAFGKLLGPISDHHVALTQSSEELMNQVDRVKLNGPEKSKALISLSLNQCIQQLTQKSCQRQTLICDQQISTLDALQSLLRPSPESTQDTVTEAKQNAHEKVSPETTIELPSAQSQDWSFSTNHRSDPLPPANLLKATPEEAPEWDRLAEKVLTKQGPMPLLDAAVYGLLDDCWPGMFSGEPVEVDLLKGSKDYAKAMAGERAKRLAANPTSQKIDYRDGVQPASVTRWLRWLTVEQLNLLTAPDLPKLTWQDLTTYGTVGAGLAYSAYHAYENWDELSDGVQNASEGLFNAAWSVGESLYHATPDIAAGMTQAGNGLWQIGCTLASNAGALVGGTGLYMLGQIGINALSKSTPRLEPLAQERIATPADNSAVDNVESPGSWRASFSDGNTANQQSIDQQLSKLLRHEFSTGEHRLNNTFEHFVAASALNELMQVDSLSDALGALEQLQTLSDSHQLDNVIQHLSETNLPNAYGKQLLQQILTADFTSALKTLQTMDLEQISSETLTKDIVTLSEQRNIRNITGFIARANRISLLDSTTSAIRPLTSAENELIKMWMQELLATYEMASQDPQEKPVFREAMLGLDRDARFVDKLRNDFNYAQSSQEPLGAGLPLDPALKHPRRAEWKAYLRQAIKHWANPHDFEVEQVKRIPGNSRALVACPHGLQTVDIGFLGDIIETATGADFRMAIERLLMRLPVVGPTLNATGFHEGNQANNLGFVTHEKIGAAAPGGTREAIKPFKYRNQLFWRGGIDPTGNTFRPRAGLIRDSMISAAPLFTALNPRADDVCHPPNTQLAQLTYEKLGTPMVAMTGLLFQEPVKITSYISEAMEAPPQPVANPRIRPLKLKPETKESLLVAPAKDQAFQASLQTHSMFMFDNADALMKALDVSTPLKRVTTDRV